MKKIIKYILLSILLIMNIINYASSEPPSPGGDPSGSGDPIGGGGAPIGEGYYILITLGIIYVVYKLYRFNTKPKETTISSTTMIN